jgi:hypothetical protein
VAAFVVDVKEVLSMENKTSRSLTNGFHLIVDALKLNGFETIYGVVASGKPSLINCAIDPTAGTESGHIGNLNPQDALARRSDE